MSVVPHLEKIGCHVRQGATNGKKNTKPCAV